MSEVRLKDRWSYKKTNGISIAEAVAWQLDGSYQDRGAVESAHATAKNTAEFMGELVTLLHSKGILTTAEVLILVSRFELLESP